MSSVHDIGVKCSGDDGSDHHLVVAEIKMKLLALKEREIKKKQLFHL